MVQRNTYVNSNRFTNEKEAAQTESSVNMDEESKSKTTNDLGSNDVVSGFLYDKLQKEVINLRKYCEVKDSSLQAKDDEIKVINASHHLKYRLVYHVP